MGLNKGIFFAHAHSFRTVTCKRVQGTKSSLTGGGVWRQTGRSKVAPYLKKGLMGVANTLKE